MELFNLGIITSDVIAMLSSWVLIIVEIVKQILPEKVPTKIVSIITAFVVTITYILIFNEITIQNIAMAFFDSFIVAFVSMFGFDSLKDIINRFEKNSISDGDGYVD